MADDDLVVRAKTDRTAFGLLYDHTYPVLLRYCVRRLFDRVVAEDVASDVFLSVASNLHTFPGTTETDFRRWLFRIATNAVNAYLRQSRRRRELAELALRHRQEANGGTSGRHPPWEMLDWPAVYQAVLDLDEPEQTILTLRFFAGCSHEEIAAVVDATPGAVRTALSRTLARLREKFNPPASSDSMLRTFSRD